MVGVLLVGVFGGLGAMSRYGVDSLLGQVAPDGFPVDAFPIGTFAVNIIGALVLGFLVEAVFGNVVEHPHWRLAAGTGFLGSFTTFSTFAVETLSAPRPGLGLLYVGATIAVGLAAAGLGMALGRAA
ncbi:MAG: fluoride efflux transporter FluC [Solirubrobacterales bacterium]